MRNREDAKVGSLRHGVLETSIPAQQGTGSLSTAENPFEARSGAQPLDARHAGSLTVRTAALLIASLALLIVMLGTPAVCPAQIAISVSFGPPALPVYTQPFCPGPGYIWTPGYWAWDPAYGYYWVPGTWVMAPFPGALWTPGYWGWNNGAYIWNPGYWGPVVGFYGGINYGFGYTGFGYQGGYWRGRTLYYNRAVNNVNVVDIRNVYNKTVINRVTVNHVSYNGGPGGVAVRPTSAQLAAARGRRVGLTSGQRQQEMAARSNPRLRASINHGRPAIAATARPGAFSGRGVVAARSAGAPYHPPARRAAGSRPAARNANPGRTARRPLITAPRGNASRGARSTPGRGQPARPRSNARATGGQPATRSPSPRQRARREYRPAEPPAARPNRNASRPQQIRRPSSESRGTDRRAAPQRQATPHPQPKGGGTERHQPHEPHA
jgi:WXXGXW repeat (2 copies)